MNIGTTWVAGGVPTPIVTTCDFTNLQVRILPSSNILGYGAVIDMNNAVLNKVKQAEPDHYTSDCAMAAHHIESGLADGSTPEHPISLLRRAYGL